MKDNVIYGSTLTTPLKLPTEDSVNVDQTYNPESENAQSGKAVAEALGQIKPDRPSNNIQIYDCATSNSSAYVMDVKTPLKTSDPLIRSIRLLGDGATIGIGSENIDNMNYRPWNYGTKSDKVNIEIGSGITELRTGVFRDLKASINNINFNNAKNNLIIGVRAFAFNDLNGVFKLPANFKIKEYAFIGNPCGIEWKSNYSDAVTEPFSNSWKTHVTQRNDDYKNISYSSSDVYTLGCSLCNILAMLKNLTNADVTIEDLVLLARNNAFAVHRYTSNTITDVTIADDKILALALTGKEAIDVSTSTVKDRKYHTLKFTFTVNEDAQTFTVVKFFKDTEQSITVTNALSVADLNNTYGITFEGVLTVGDTIIVSINPYEGTSGGTAGNFIKFVADKYNLSCTVLERPLEPDAHNRYLLNQLTKGLYIIDTTGEHSVIIRGCNEKGDVYVIDPEDKTLNEHTQDLQYVFADTVPESSGDFPSNKFNLMHKVHYKNLWCPRPGKTSWASTKGVTFRITADGVLEIYGTCTSSANIPLHDTSVDCTLDVTKPYTIFTSPHLGVGGNFTNLGQKDNIVVLQPSNPSFNELKFRFDLRVSTNYGTAESPTRYKCMCVEGNYLDQGLTFFPYEA